MIGLGSLSGGLTGGTDISIKFFGVDSTARTFRAIGGRIDGLGRLAAGFSAKFATLGKAVLPALSIGMLARGIGQTVNALSELSDRAADAGTTSPALQKLTGALQQLGVRGASLDMVSKAMQNMARLTGETGAEGFAKVLGQASRLSTEAERLTFLSQAFGRQQGAAFAAIVREGDGAVRKLVDLAAEYPAVSDASSNTADRAADAMLRASDAIKAGWGEMVVSMVDGIEAAWGPLPEVASGVARKILIAFKAVVDTFKAMALGFRILIEPIVNTVITLTYAVDYIKRALTDSTYSIRDAFTDTQAIAESVFSGMVEGWNATAEPLFDFSNIGANAETKPLFDQMRNAIGQGGVAFRNEAGKAADGLASTIRDSAPKGAAWALEGSAAARRIINGDPYRNGAEQADRAVARTLPTISDAVRRMAAGVDEMNDFFGELEAV